MVCHSMRGRGEGGGCPWKFLKLKSLTREAILASIKMIKHTVKFDNQGNQGIWKCAGKN